MPHERRDESQIHIKRASILFASVMRPSNELLLIAPPAAHRTPNRTHYTQMPGDDPFCTPFPLLGVSAKEQRGGFESSA